MNLAVTTCLFLLFLIIIYIIIKKNKVFKNQEISNYQYQLLNENFIVSNSELKFNKSRLEEVNLLNKQLNSTGTVGGGAIWILNGTNMRARTANCPAI